MTQKSTEFGLGVTDFCMNCICYAMDGPADDPLKHGTCRAALPTHRGFPVVYADQWCQHHVLSRSEQMKRLKEVSELNKASREPGRIFSPDEPITIIPPVNTWEHYPDVDGL